VLVSSSDRVEEVQSAHYDELGAEYDAHYSDPTSKRYRDLFINAPLTAAIELQGRDVLEGMCGSGATAEYLLTKGARVTGLDISPKLVAAFRAKWPHARAIEGSILDSHLPSTSYDCVVVVGGLHHVQARVQQAIDEIERILKPGGYFCFAEPHTGSLPDAVRRLWYKRDRLFTSDEEALDVDALEASNRDRFEILTKHYGGNLAYLLVFNSMVFRIPLAWKRVYAPVTLRLETIMGGLQGRRLSCFVVCQWRKKSVGA
jgi:SAM-dependent methyltransferase